MTRMSFLDLKFLPDYLEKLGFTQNRIQRFDAAFEIKLSERMASVNSRDAHDHSHYTNWIWQKKKFKRLNKIQKEIFLCLLRSICFLYYEKNHWSVLQECYERTILLCDGWTYNTKLYRMIRISDINFILEQEEFLSTLTSLERRNFFRTVKSECPSETGKVSDWFYSVLEDFFLVEFQRSKAKELVRHKGYRDHGSLGSESAKTAKDQSSDAEYQYYLRKQEEIRYKRQHPKSNALSDYFDLI